MNAASLKHARVHNKVVVLLNKKFPNLDWFIDLDYRKITSEGQILIRPDLVGIDPDTLKTVFAVEISFSTLRNDLELKRKIYEEFCVQNYVVFDCQNEVVHQFTMMPEGLVDSTCCLVDQSEFKEVWK